MTKRLLFIMGFFIVALSVTGGTVRGSEKEVSFKTEDGWTIYGMLGTPVGGASKVPAVLLLHSFDHDRNAYGHYLYAGLAEMINARGIATLRIDIRGRGESIGSKELHSFNSEELSKLHLDVRGALEFLASQEAVDSSRIAIVAEGLSADSAVLGSGGGSSVKALALISGRLTDTAKKQLSGDSAVPLFLVVSKEDRQGFRDAADAYKVDHNPDTRITVYKDIGLGTTMFSVWRSEHPKEPPIEDGIADWLGAELNSAGQAEEVSFKSEDGWTIYGTLWSPSRSGPKTVPATAESAGTLPSAPGVVLIHSSFTDRHIFDHLARLMVGRGMVVLNLDTRGRGKSIGKGEFLTMPVDEREKGYLDVKAAVNFLAGRPGTGRIGLLGTDRGASYALSASIGDSRVGAIVLMTALLGAEEKKQIADLEIPIFYVASKDIQIAATAMAEAYAASKNRRSRILTFNGGALGYQIFDFDPTLEPTLADWVKEALSR
jgi:dienelactone hydrolase